MERSDRSRAVRRVAFASTVATLLLIAMGGAVRATDSGLACPDWPACHGAWIPPADLNMWLEHSHRLWAGVVALMIAGLLVLTARRRRIDRLSFHLAALAAMLVVVQAALGAAVVLLHLRAGLVTSHLGMSLVIVAALIVIAARSRPATAVEASAIDRAFARRAGAVAALVFAQALLGGQATGRGAAYVFNAFPIWLTDDAWTGHVREVLHVTHRIGGYLVAGVVIALAIHARRIGVFGWPRRLARLAVALVAIQVGLGVANVLTSASVASAIGHLAVASWLWSTLVIITALALVPAAAAPAPSVDDAFDNRSTHQPPKEVVV